MGGRLRRFFVGAERSGNAQGKESSESPTDPLDEGEQDGADREEGWVDESGFDLEEGSPKEELEEQWYKVVERKLSNLPIPEGKDRRTWDGVFDKRTLMTLYRLFSTRVLDAMDFPISTGKEADVFRASAPEGTRLCVKIYRVAKATFHNMLPYIQGDPRFQGIKRDRQSLTTAWAQKEFRNLGRAVEAGVRVPRPVMSTSNVLVMEYLGTEEGPYPLLKDVALDDWAEVAQELVESYRLLVGKARLVHADLSEYNVIMTPEGPVIIDIGQAVVLEHPMAEEFFDKDVRNLSRFFARRGVKISQGEFKRQILDNKTFQDLL